MKIVSIKKVNSLKYAFKTDEEYSFFLTRQELSEYGLYGTVLDLLEGGTTADELDVALPENICESIKKETVLPRGKRYAVGLLSDRDYTEKKLTDKLRETGYAESDRKVIISFLKEKNFLSDLRYATSYVRVRYKSKSRRYIEGKLYEKGISEETIKEAFDAVEEEVAALGESPDEIRRSAIARALSAKLKDCDASDRDKIAKVMQSIVRKGFDYREVKRETEKFFADKNE